MQKENNCENLCGQYIYPLKVCLFEFCPKKQKKPKESAKKSKKSRVFYFSMPYDFN